MIEGTFQIDASPPNLHCMEVWNATDDLPATMTAGVVDLPDGFFVEAIATIEGNGDDAVFNFLSGENLTSATVNVSSTAGALIWFKIGGETEPPGGGEGCTPGYWRQEHHYDSWVNYAPGDLFSSVFADAFPGETLGEVVRAKGGGLNALGRHAVAALLNAASAGVDYDYTEAEVIAAFNAAFASGDADIIEDQKDVFDFLNNQGCGLN